VKTLTILGMASMAFVVWFTWYEATRKDQGKGQSRRMSLAEAWTNIAIGLSINYVSNIWMIPLMADKTDVPISWWNYWWGGWVFTTISMFRQYTIRRFFNSHIQRFIEWVAGVSRR